MKVAFYFFGQPSNQATICFAHFVRQLFPLFFCFIFYQLCFIINATESAEEIYNFMSSNIISYDIYTFPAVY